MPKGHLFSSIFNIKIATQKFTNFDKVFFKCTLIWQLSQYNVTKLFHMKLKTTKRHYSHHIENMEKNPKELFGPPNIDTSFIYPLTNVLGTLPVTNVSDHI